MNQLSYKPSTYHYRAAVKGAKRKAQVIILALEIIDEHERLRDWVRGHGLVPPKWFVTPSERAALVQGSAIRFPTTKALSAMAAPPEPVLPA